MLRLNRTRIQQLSQTLGKHRPYATSGVSSREAPGVNPNDVENVGNPKKWMKLKELQERYQRDDGVPVHLKGGLMDKVLLGTTWVLIVLGLYQTAQFVYKLGWRR